MPKALKFGKHCNVKDTILKCFLASAPAKCTSNDCNSNADMGKALSVHANFVVVLLAMSPAVLPVTTEDG